MEKNTSFFIDNETELLRDEILQWRIW